MYGGELQCNFCKNTELFIEDYMQKLERETRKRLINRKDLSEYLSWIKYLRSSECFEEQVEKFFKYKKREYRDNKKMLRKLDKNRLFFADKVERVLKENKYYMETVGVEIVIKDDKELKCKVYDALSALEFLIMLTTIKNEELLVQVIRIPDILYILKCLKQKYEFSPIFI